MTSDYQRAIAEESARFRTALRAAAPAAPVPSCPDWTAEDLLWHLVQTQSFWALVLRGNAQSYPEAENLTFLIPDRPADYADMAELAAETTGELLGALESRDDAEPLWTWFLPEQNVGFVRRRQAHEALIHRVDAELAAALPSAPIDAGLAADGIDAIIDIEWVPPRWSTFTPAGGVVELVAPEGSWRVQGGRWAGTSPTTGNMFDEPTALRADPQAEPAARVEADAETLDRWLWNRAPAPAASGDADALAALQAAITIGVQ